MSRRLTKTRLALALGLAVLLLATMLPFGSVAADDNAGPNIPLRATTYAGALVGKLLLILNGVLDNYVRCEVVNDGNTPVYVIIGLTEKGQNLVNTLAALILNYTTKMVADLEQSSTTDSAALPPP
jgi:fumarate reductase subunit D